jgi:TPR repeat protein
MWAGDGRAIGFQSMGVDQSKLALDVFSRGFDLESKGDIEGAIHAYSEAAKLGSSSALVNLGNIFDDVISPPDPERAVSCYKSAAELGNPAGAWCLAVHYRNLGNDEQYLHWLKTAADMGEEDAIEILSAN